MHKKPQPHKREKVINKKRMPFLMVLEEKVELILEEGRVVGVSADKTVSLLGSSISELDNWIEKEIEADASTHIPENIEELIRKYSFTLDFELIPINSITKKNTTLLTISPDFVSTESIVEGMEEFLNSLKKPERISKAYKKIGELASKKIDFYGFGVWEIDEGRLYPSYLFVDGNEVNPDDFGDVKIKHTELAQRLHNNQSFYFPDSESINKSDISGYVKDSSIETIFLAPILSQDKADGFISILSRRKDAYSKEEQEYIKTLAEFLSLAKKMKSLYDSQVRIANRDCLTDVLNTNSFKNLVFDELESKSPDSLCLVYLDLDNFKKVNDTFGHDVGDKEIKLFADMLKRNTRSEDYIIRKGGDEFVVLLSNVSEGKGYEIMERIKQDYEKYTKNKSYPDLFSGENKRLSDVGLDFSYGIRELEIKKPAKRELFESEVNKKLKETEKKMYYDKNQ
jgi:diguanylate cyclase (GGDEF)-like protein